MHDNSRQNNFDLIRLVAAVQVVLSHAIGHTGLRETLPEWGQHAFDALAWLPGVPVFFVISGFLIMRSYERNRGDLAGYFRNRALRIFPALWVCLAVTVVLLGVFGFLPWSYVFSRSFTEWLLGQAGFVQFYNPEQFRAFGIGVANGALWTISVELQFYVFVPLFSWLAGRLEGRRFAALAGVTFLGSFLAFCLMNVKVNGPGGFTGAPFVWKLLFNTLAPHLWMFMTGILIHWNFVRLRPVLEGRFLIWMGLYAAVAATTAHLVPEFSPGYYACVLAARLILGLATVSAAYSARHLAGTLLRGNDISYGVYIYHSLVINVLVETGSLGSLAAVPVTLVLTAAAAWASWRWIEKPALARKAGACSLQAANLWTLEPPTEASIQSLAPDELIGIIDRMVDEPDDDDG